MWVKCSYVVRVMSRHRNAMWSHISYTVQVRCSYAVRVRSRHCNTLSHVAQAMYSYVSCRQSKALYRLGKVSYRKVQAKYHTVRFYDGKANCSVLLAIHCWTNQSNLMALTLYTAVSYQLWTCNVKQSRILAFFSLATYDEIWYRLN